MEETNASDQGRLWAALEYGANVLASDPAVAERHAQAILHGLPGQQQTLMLLVSARRSQGDTAGARAMLETMAMTYPKIAAVQHELGLLLAELGETAEAIEALSRAVELEPNHPTAWRALGDQLAEMGERSRAAEAYGRHFASSVNDLKLIENAGAFPADQLQAAEGILSAFLEIYPTDAFALRALADVYVKLGRPAEAEDVLARAVELAPSYVEARYNYAVLLFRAEKWIEAKREIDAALEKNPRNAEYRGLKAVVLKELGEHQQVIECYEETLQDSPGAPEAWVAYGHALKIVGRGTDCIAAFRKAIELEPACAEAWWALSNLKTYRFTPADIEAMQALLKAEGTSKEDRSQLHFALGKAFEDTEAYSESFEHYRKGNALRRAALGYDRTSVSQHIDRSKALFTREFFAARDDFGYPSPDPIFIVGLARTGSTLIEQILSSHSMIEGTMELPDIALLAKDLNERGEASRPSRYPEILGSLEAAELRSFGEEYLERTRLRRKSGRPFFTDKAPNNVQHIGLIHLILPNAKIIDVRRHPMACGFSLFKQYFATGMNFAYDLTDIGWYYRDYVDLMAHYDAVLPGHVHRVFYEDLLRDPEREVRSLLDYCGVPFEDSCLRFYQTPRNIRTASAEQVRQPLYPDALGQWRHYETWLGPLKDALGPVLDAYPGVPAA